MGERLTALGQVFRARCFSGRRHGKCTKPQPPPWVEVRRNDELVFTRKGVLCAGVICVLRVKYFRGSRASRTINRLDTEDGHNSPGTTPTR